MLPPSEGMVIILGHPLRATNKNNKTGEVVRAQKVQLCLELMLMH
jgi:hypothetical protein